ncbi:F-box and leucine-rich repeat protein 13 isoform X2 [Brachyhypopomus gauderio]|uniref:F-box and leucine-rich repeat protein 13 isoform X2 n=1 Tax=Brachyhypopomus gauderio TaxID=698409 RepID=UPI004042618E
MASLKKADPVFREYFLKHSLPQIFKALLASLCVSCPEDPLHFIESKLLAIQENQALEIHWHSCFDDVHTVTVSLLAKSIVHDIFGGTDDIMFQSHLLEKAYLCYQTNVTKMCFKGWRQYISKRKADAARLLFLTHSAERHYVLQNTRFIFTSWANWVHVRKRKQSDAVKKIQCVWDAVLCKVVIAAWRHVAQDAKRTKEYFERMEKGMLDTHGKHIDLSQADGQDRLSLLPWKLSVKIFQNLGVGELLKCSRVCGAWKALAQTCSLWSRINISAERQRITDEAVVRILQKHRPFITQLNMSGCGTLHHASFRCISECKNLQDLNLSECTNINDDIMWIILEACPSLLTLNLSYTNVTDSTWRAMSRNCMTLQSLSLAYCRRFTDKGLQVLTTGRGCHGLTHLDLSGCTQISVDGFRHIAKSCSLLQHIVCDDMTTLSDACIQALASKCHSLAVISVLDTPYLSDTAFEAIAEVASLTKFKIEGNGRVTDSGWKALCRASPNLTVLHAPDCSRMTDTSMKYISSLRNLHTLHLAGFEKLSDAGIRYMAEGPCASKLRELDLSNCPQINDLSIMRLSQRCTKLSKLSVCYCESLTDSSVEYLSGCSSLVTLDITGCSVQDQGLIALGAVCTLRELIAPECVWITDIGIEKFCRQARDLELMDVRHCLSLSDQSIKLLSFYCRNITTLRMAGCPKMTDMALQYLTGACHYLRELDLSGCVLLTDRTPRLLHRACPQLSTVSMLYCRNISRQAALRLQPRVQQWEHSRDDPPCSYGYGSMGCLPQPVRKPEEPLGR